MIGTRAGKVGHGGAIARAQGDLNAVAYFAGRDPVFGIMGDLIAGYDTVEQKQMFFRFGGGKTGLEEAVRQSLRAFERIRLWILRLNRIAWTD